MKTPILFALALAAATPAAMPAYADGPAAVGVRFSDLNLNQPTDAAIMLDRLDQAAMQACGAFPFSSLREYRVAVRGSQCFTRSLSRAVAELNAPEVTAVYEHHAGDFGTAR
jgi:UrcA family protein